MAAPSPAPIPMTKAIPTMYGTIVVMNALSHPIRQAMTGSATMMATKPRKKRKIQGMPDPYGLGNERLGMPGRLSLQAKPLELDRGAMALDRDAVISNRFPLCAPEATCPQSEASRLTVSR